MNTGYREAGVRRQLAVLDAPSNLGLRPPAPGIEPGARKLAAALRSRDLVQRLGARDAGGVPAPPYEPGPDHVVGYRNGTALAAYTLELADAVERELATEAGELLVVLGGDCSVVLGPLLALRRRGRYGVAFVDAHDDYSPPLDPDRYAGLCTAAGLDLALATGHGPPALVDLEHLRPYVREDDVVHLGLVREPGDATYADVAAFEASAIRRYSAEQIRGDGAVTLTQRAADELAAAELGGFWVHLDADVLDETIMPAVDSPNSGGLTADELTDVLGLLLSSPAAVGMDVCIYDPHLDATGAAGDLLADVVVSALGR